MIEQCSTEDTLTIVVCLHLAQYGALALIFTGACLGLVGNANKATVTPEAR